MRSFLIIAAVVLAFLSQSAMAHTRSQSFSNWTIDDHQAQFVFAVDTRRVTQLASIYPETSSLQSLLELHLSETLGVIQAGKQCEMSQLATVGEGRVTVRVSGHFTCSNKLSNQDVEVKITSFFAVSPTHIHIARISYLDGIRDQVLREGRETFTLNAEKPPQSIWDFIRVGFKHVLSGADHLAFLAALALVAVTRRSAVLCITGFTLGHTLALALVTLGLVDPDLGLIEALIGFTIAFTALEAGQRHGLVRRRAMLGFAFLVLSIWLVALGSGGGLSGMGLALLVFIMASRQLSAEAGLKLFPMITALFGLVHGAGFASGFNALSLNKSELWFPLLGFNIGVEIAQLMTLVAIYLVFNLLSRKSVIRHQSAEKYAGVILFSLGCFWFASRIWA